jgi:hypothetical protein
MLVCFMTIRCIVVKQLDSIELCEMNLLNESLSMNVFRMWGMAFIPDKTEPDIDRESEALTQGCTV